MIDKQQSRQRRCFLRGEEYLRRLTTIQRYETADGGGVLIPCLGACGGSPAASSNRPSAARDSAAVRLLPCGETIGAQRPWQGMSVVLGVVALPASSQMRRALQ